MNIHEELKILRELAAVARDAINRNDHNLFALAKVLVEYEEYKKANSGD